MRRYGLVALLLAAGMGWPGDAATRIPEWAEVRGERVNLRARPDLQSEVAGQVGLGERLKVLSIVEDWVEVAPPATVDLWVHAEFVIDGEVQASRLNVRAGPGINFHTVGRLERGMRVEEREILGEWMRIAPPAGTSLFVHRELLRIPEPPPPEPEPAAPVPRPEPQIPEPPEPEETPEVTEPAPDPVIDLPRTEIPRRWRLAAVEGQGRQASKQGVLGRAGFHVRRPARYRLVRTAQGRVHFLCYVHGDRQTLRSHLGYEVKLHGRLFWIEGVRHPVLLIDEMEPIIQARPTR